MATQGNAWAQSSDTHDPNVLRGFAAAVFGLPVASHANAISDTARAGGYGVVGGGDLLVAGTGGLNYSIAAGRVVAAGTSSSAQGAYVGYNTAGYTGSLDAHSAFIRHDLICYRVRDTDVDGSGAEADDFAVVKGTTGSTDPAIPASLGSLVVLARAVVPATSGTPTFTDLRPRATAAGGIHVCTSSTRPTGVMLHEGKYITETDTDRDQRYNGTSWDIISEPPQTWNVTTVGQPGPVSVTTAYGRYQRTRGRVDGSLVLNVTGTGTADEITIATPITMASSEAVGGSFTIVDDANTVYEGSVFPSTTTSFRLQVNQNALPLGDSPALVLAPGDIIRVHHFFGWY